MWLKHFPSIGATQFPISILKVTGKAPFFGQLSKDVPAFNDQIDFIILW